MIIAPARRRRADAAKYLQEKWDMQIITSPRRKASGDLIEKGVPSDVANTDPDIDARHALEKACA